MTIIIIRGNTTLNTIIPTGAKDSGVSKFGITPGGGVIAGTWSKSKEPGSMVVNNVSITPSTELSEVRTTEKSRA